MAAADREDIPARRPVVAAYDPSWPDRASQVLGVVEAAAGGLAARVAHIGSTAIPGMAAKSVIDVQLSVHDLDQATEVLEEPLGRHGFAREPYDRDHLPAGCDDDPERWRKRVWSRRGHPDGDVNLHVRLVGSPNERVALLFRDWFRAHPQAVRAYAEFKRRASAVAADMASYNELKDPVVDLVIAAAEPWAATTGWHPMA